MEKPVTLGSLQVRHLKTQRMQLVALHKYHAWMGIELKDPELREAHLKIATSVQYVLEHLDSLLDILQMGGSDPVE
jgi:hypothetical protein